MRPSVISVSRREDVPAFKGEWFMEKLREKHVVLVNSFSGAPYDVMLDKVKFAVFWTKNPEPFLKYLTGLPFDFYFQFTLNDYPEFEHNVPSLEDRISTFKKLSEKIGKERVVWRFDPLIVNDSVNVRMLTDRISRLGDQLFPFTEKLVFSFVDPYKKLMGKFPEISTSDKTTLVENLVNLNERWNLSLETCTELFTHNSVKKSSCIDEELMKRISGFQRWVPHDKDKNQRNACGCVSSVDIGSYRECSHKCDYCYAK